MGARQPLASGCRPVGDPIASCHHSELGERDRSLPMCLLEARIRRLHCASLLSSLPHCMLRVDVKEPLEHKRVLTGGANQVIIKHVRRLAKRGSECAMCGL